MNRPPPHILLVIGDDIGWGDVGFHRPSPSSEVATPTIDALVRAGIELGRHYVHRMCTPSRTALQTGRLPIHVITTLADPCDVSGAFPRNMTGLAAKLRSAGYATHHVGKWSVRDSNAARLERGSPTRTRVRPCAVRLPLMRSVSTCVDARVCV